MDKKGQYFQKRVVFSLSEEFKNRKGDLSIVHNDRPYKYCYYCCKELQGIKSKLVKHSNGWHKGKEPRFLKFEEQPQTNMYLNFDEYLENPRNTLLKWKPEYSGIMKGRPMKEDKHVDQNDKHHKSKDKSKKKSKQKHKKEPSNSNLLRKRLQPNFICEEIQKENGEKKQKNEKDNEGQHLNIVIDLGNQNIQSQSDQEIDSIQDIDSMQFKNFKRNDSSDEDMQIMENEPKKTKKDGKQQLDLISSLSQRSECIIKFDPHKSQPQKPSIDDTANIDILNLIGVDRSKLSFDVIESLRQV